MSQDRFSHAVVVGGSLAGMLSARVLSDHFSQVTIVERDEYPERPQPRPGIPQSRHVHGMLLRGTHIIESMFPGITDELLKRGTIKVDVGEDVEGLTSQGWGIRFRSGMTVLSFTGGAESVLRSAANDQAAFGAVCSAACVLRIEDSP